MGLAPGNRGEGLCAGLVACRLCSLVNEAVQGFIEKRGAELQADLERTIAGLKAIRKRDPGFESAIGQFVAAEAKLGGTDPFEGGLRQSAGPAQSMVRDLLGG